MPLLRQFLTLILISGLFMVGCGRQQATGDVATESLAWNKVCPVQGGDIDPEIATVEYMGKQYGFCCSGCDKNFSADPARYAANLSTDGKHYLPDSEEHSETEHH